MIKLCQKERNTTPLTVRNFANGLIGFNSPRKVWQNVAIPVIAKDCAPIKTRPPIRMTFEVSFSAPVREVKNPMIEKVTVTNMYRRVTRTHHLCI
mmetsp:Transcript_79413/g.227891  ORF Transcript_79413/g.227891 Transcript_79413/m.227891 type:complete len:95 (+) Transcript_79413:984-1268(+)